MELDPIEVINAKIRQGWGDTAPHKIPQDWQTKRGPDNGASRRQKSERCPCGRYPVASARVFKHKCEAKCTP